MKNQKIFLMAMSIIVLGHEIVASQADRGGRPLLQRSPGQRNLNYDGNIRPKLQRTEGFYDGDFEDQSSLTVENNRMVVKDELRDIRKEKEDALRDLKQLEQELNKVVTNKESSMQDFDRIEDVSNQIKNMSFVLERLSAQELALESVKAQKGTRRKLVVKIPSWVDKEPVAVSAENSGSDDVVVDQRSSRPLPPPRGAQGRGKYVNGDWKSVASIDQSDSDTASLSDSNDTIVRPMMKVPQLNPRLLDEIQSQRSSLRPIVRRASVQDKQQEDAIGSVLTKSQKYQKPKALVRQDSDASAGDWE